MPSAVPLSNSARIDDAAATSKHARPTTKKTRVVRRRGRAKLDLESDDEFEREVGTDSDSDGEQSSLDSASDSDTEPASEDVVPNSHSRVLTPSTSHSIDDTLPIEKRAVAHTNEDVSPFFSGAGNWSEMVADETTNGPQDLPVIEFADFDTHTAPPSSPRSHEPPKKTQLVEEHKFEEGLQDSIVDSEPIASTSRNHDSAPSAKRPPGQTARQAYQRRLETDPSYVPTVGEFWGHDDRLLDKDLRSLSGWWRGRWHGRGRGRGGMDRGFARGRGRTGYIGSQSSNVANQSGLEDGDEPSDSKIPMDVPPVEREWTHDGFEEMKRREERRRSFQQQQQQQQGFRGFGGFRGGRGGFVPIRGRGFVRGGFVPSPTRGRAGLPFVPSSSRPWFAMKPERMWTKQHDGFLHFDPALKPRPGQGLSIRVKLPGEDVTVVRTPPLPHQSTSSIIAKPATASILGSEYGEKAYVVCIPPPVTKRSSAPATSTVRADSADKALDDVFTVRPRLAPREPILTAQVTAPSVSGTSSISITSITSPQPTQTVKIPSSKSAGPASESNIDQPVKDRTTPDSPGWIQIDTASIGQFSSDSANIQTSAVRPALPPLQTVFTPPAPQASPPYGSPYGYAPSLPQGIAVNQHGMPYELATGRPVYLQPPAPMYNPRPIMHTHLVPPGIPLIPGHTHHHSTASPEFIEQSSHSPPINGFIDPSTGTPIFSLPRQNSRVEIRAPSALSDGKASSKPSRPSGLRTSAASFEPSHSADHGAHGYFPPTTLPVGDEAGVSYPTVTGGDEVSLHQQSHQMAGVAMTYPAFIPQYYYPEGYTDQYVYSSYVDMSQAGHYEMYPPDPRIPQGTIYY